MTIKQLTVDYTEYLKKLDEIILNTSILLRNLEMVHRKKRIYKIIEEGNNITKDNSYSKGLSTPHFYSIS